jgi:hypothetical protein
MLIGVDRRTISAMRRLALLALAVSSCASAAMSRLPEHEQDAFQRCVRYPACAQVMCGYQPDAFLSAGCFQQKAGEYAELPDEHARRTFLVRNGCPREMVEE